MKKFYIFALCVVLAGTAFVVTGCGKKAAEKAAEKAIEKATNGQANVDLGTNSVKVNTNAGSLQVGGNITLPSSFPSDVYVIDGTIKAASTVKEGEIYTVTIETSKTVAEAKVKYENELKNDGWTIALSMDYGTSASVGAKKGDRTVTVAIGESEGKTLVSLSVSKTVQ